MQHKLAAMLAALVLQTGCALHLPNKDFVEGDFEVIDTGLDESTGNTIWLDNDNLIVNALQLVPQARPKKLFRVVIFNLKQRSARVLIPQGSMHCVNEISRLAKVRIFTDAEDVDGSSVVSYMRLSPEGKLSAYDLPSPYTSPCRLAEPRKPDRLQIFCAMGMAISTGAKQGEAIASRMPSSIARTRPLLNCQYAVVKLSRQCIFLIGINICLISGAN